MGLGLGLGCGICLLMLCFFAGFQRLHRRICLQIEKYSMRPPERAKKVRAEAEGVATVG